MALLQSTFLTKGQPSEISSECDTIPNGQATSKTDKLILEPPHQKELLQLYADHSSHASHSSHVSGMGGGDSYDSTPSTPYYPPSTPPVTYPTTPQPAPTPVVPAPIANTVVETNSATDIVTSTNEAAVTNASNDQVFANKEYINSLKQDAAKGSSSSQYVLALCYLHGQSGCETNVEKAKMLLELSSIQGNSEAKERLEKLETAK